MIRFVLSFFFLTLSLFATPVGDTYPSVGYVLSEFEIDPGYAYNDRFTAYVATHERGMKRFYKRSIKEGKWLVSMVRGELLEEDMSDLFLYISIVESGLHTEIRSSKQAVGLWQFMPKTARGYNLLVCNSEDERCDPVRSTRAAIQHLRHLHQKFGRWYLAVLAYNCGEGRLSRAIAKAGTDDIGVLLDPFAKYLPKETREYLMKILLVAMIGESEVVQEDPLSKGQMKQTDNGTGAQPMSEVHLLSHYVVLGESLEGIAETYRSNKYQIMRANGLKEESLEVGALLVIPVSEDVFYRTQEGGNSSASSRDKEK